MTQPQPPLNLDAVRERYANFVEGPARYPGLGGETTAEYWSRVDPELHSDAAISAQDVPVLLAEIERLQQLVHPAVQAQILKLLLAAKAWQDATQAMGSNDGAVPPFHVRLHAYDQATDGLHKAVLAYFGAVEEAAQP